MKILIAKANQDIIREILPSVKFIESTKNTCYFSIQERTFLKLREEVRARGYNSYALMAW